MDTSEPILANSIDKLIFIFISGSLTSFFFLWFIANILQTNTIIIWLLSVPLSFISVIFLSRYYSLYHEKISRFTVVCYVLFFFFLALGSLYYVEPVIRYPYAAIGIPNKDLHDGISVFINKYGYPPSDSGYLSQNEQFIPNTNKGLFLGYPNVFHVVAAFFMKLGVSEFHATWFSMLFPLILSSLSIFLILRVLWKDMMLASILGGLFMISSSRIPYGIVTSIPMMFAYSLLLPTFLVSLVSFRHSKHAMSLIIPALAICTITASYFGMTLIIVGMLALYVGILAIKKNYGEVKKFGYLCILTFPPLLLVLFFQKTIYWQNMFPTAKDFDPYELSQYLFPLDKAFYMVVYFISFFVFIYLFQKKDSKLLRNPLALFVFIINCGLLILLPFDSLFHSINNVYSTNALIKVNPLGLFGGLNHQRASRLALMQPYFFIFIIPALFTLIRFKTVRYTSLILVILVSCIFVFDIPLYDMLHFHFQDDRYGLYNDKDTDKPYALLSHYRFIIPQGLWSQEIMNGLNFLKSSQIKQTSEIVLWDERSWPESSIAGWGSIYLQKKVELLYSVLKLERREFRFEQVAALRGKGMYLMVIMQSKEMANMLYPFEMVFENPQVAIYRIE